MLESSLARNKLATHRIQFFCGTLADKMRGKREFNPLTGMVCGEVVSVTEKQEGNKLDCAMGSTAVVREKETGKQSRENEWEAANGRIEEQPKATINDKQSATKVGGFPERGWGGRSEYASPWEK